MRIVDARGQITEWQVAPARINDEADCVVMDLQGNFPGYEDGHTLPFHMTPEVAQALADALQKTARRARESS